MKKASPSQVSIYVGIALLVLTLVCLTMRWNAAAFVFGGSTLAGFVVLSAMAAETQLDMVASCPPQLARARRTAMMMDAPPPPAPSPVQQQPPQWQQLQQQQQLQRQQQLQQQQQWQQLQQQWQQQQLEQQWQQQQQQLQQQWQQWQQPQTERRAPEPEQQAPEQRAPEPEQQAPEPELPQPVAASRLSTIEYVSDEPTSAEDVRARGLYGIKPDFNDEIMQRGAVMNKGFIQPLAARREFARYLAYDMSNRRDQFMVKKDSS
jgi:hypothetical protein